MGRRRARTGLLVALVAVTMLAAVALLRSGMRGARVAPPMAHAGDTASAGAATDREVVPAVADAALFDHEEPPPPPREELVAGVRCTLLDAHGVPLDGFRVQLATRDYLPAPPRDPWPQVRSTGPGGTCSWRHPGAGSYRVELSDRPSVHVALQLEDDGGAAVELRLPEGLVACGGRFVRRGGDASDVVARFRLADGSEVTGDTTRRGQGASVSLERDPRIRTVLPAGTCRLRGLAPPHGARGESGPLPAASRLSERLRSMLESGWQLVVDRELLVPSGVARFEWQVDVDVAEVVFVVTAEHGPLTRAAELRIEGTTTLAGQPIVQDVATGAGDRAFLAGLPPGAYRVRASGPLVLSCDEVDFDVRAGESSVTVPVTLREGALVRLEVAGIDGRRISLAPELLPPLVAGGREFPCVELAGGGHEVGFLGVPPGRVTLAGGGRAVDGALRFLPFDPLPPQEVTVRTGTDNRLDVRVELRAHVDLRACHASGREQFDATVRVFAGERPVRSDRVEHPNRWAGFLPPGDYRVVVDRGGRTREHGLAVDRRSQRLRLRP